MQGHNHGARRHLLGMLGVGVVVLLLLLAAGRTVGEALPLAAALACPLMMIGMIFMMGRGHSQSHGSSCHPESARLDDGSGADPVNLQERPTDAASSDLTRSNGR
ncbi:DUF2933 domain-containing protein [Georgenia yuyongxinii]|uniref:DUF2933 domain-containing protein n=1 Tax=Georgenia yuyongxinii TaxID=2589797 RepID=A0A552WSU4_9MICO|nr:DUF2933 domain-containing protein [Georgenia yuyongxinii]TRW45745.1 DUF2933 domain-containing protein [Georgenia yuyongxinii]